MDHMTEICKAALDSYGIEEQLLQAMEELAEHEPVRGD